MKKQWKILQVSVLFLLCPVVLNRGLTTFPPIPFVASPPLLHSLFPSQPPLRQRWRAVHVQANIHIHQWYDWIDASFRARWNQSRWHSRQTLCSKTCLRHAASVGCGKPTLFSNACDVYARNQWKTKHGRCFWFDHIVAIAAIDQPQTFATHATVFCQVPCPCTGSGSGAWLFRRHWFCVGEIGGGSGHVEINKKEFWCVDAIVGFSPKIRWLPYHVV